MDNLADVAITAVSEPAESEVLAERELTVSVEPDPAKAQRAERKDSLELAIGNEAPADDHVASARFQLSYERRKRRHPSRDETSKPAPTKV
jgi:hypothetical protein